MARRNPFAELSNILKAMKGCGVTIPAPVTGGSRIRARTILQSVEKTGEAVQIVYLITVEIENNDKPACVAESIVRVM